MLISHEVWIRFEVRPQSDTTVLRKQLTLHSVVMWLLFYILSIWNLKPMPFNRVGSHATETGSGFVLFKKNTNLRKRSTVYSVNAGEIMTCRPLVCLFHSRLENYLA